MRAESLRRALTENASLIEQALQLQQYDALQRHVKQRGTLLRAWCEAHVPSPARLVQEQSLQQRLIDRVIAARDDAITRIEDGRRHRQANRAYLRASGM